MVDRTPRDGLPYYCANCGLGYGEWLACDHLECGTLEPVEDAQARLPTSTNSESNSDGQ